MPQNFLTRDRDQPMLLPPDLRDWLDEDHLAWFVIDAVDELDLAPFYAAYRADGHGRAAHEPKMMLTLLAYAYAVGERSARGIERRCREDVAFRVITANQAPDHATVARFRVRHQEALAELFGQVLALCADAGLVTAGVLAVDGSKFRAAAADSAIRTYEEIAREIVAEAGRIDAAEDEIHGEARGDELPEPLTTQHGRKAWIKEAKRRLDAERAQRQSQSPGTAISGSRPAIAASSMTGRPSARRTAPTRTTAPAEWRATAGASAPGRSPTSRPPNRRAGSTPPTRTQSG